MNVRTPVQRLLHQRTSPLNLLVPLHQRLAFSTSSRQLAVRKPINRAPQQPQIQQPAQKSYEVLKKEQMGKLESLPNDIGLVPDTLVMPMHLPSITREPAARWALEKHRLWLRMKEFATRYIMGLIYVRPIPKFETAKIPSIAKSLYKEMYTAFAAGDLTPVRSKLCENITMVLESRIAARNPNTAVTWTLHQQLSEPRTMSHKYMPLDLESSDKTKATTLQQAVVRLHTVQSLKMVKKVRAGNKTMEVEEEGSNPPTEVIEYFVVQRTMKYGKLGEWMIWGTTTESDIRNIGK